MSYELLKTEDEFITRILELGVKVLNLKSEKQALEKQVKELEERIKKLTSIYPQL